MRVLIDNGNGFQDYTRYVVDETLTVEDSVNVPTVTNFVLAATDNTFVVPKRSAYVKVESEIYLGTPAVSGVYIGQLPQQVGPVQGYFLPVDGGVNHGTYGYTYPLDMSKVTLNQTGTSLSVHNNVGTVTWDTVDVNGHITGTTPVNIPGSPGEFAMAGVCNLYVPTPGTYPFNVFHQDGSIFAIEGASVVSGPANNNPAGQVVTPVMGYSFNGGLFPVAAANNTGVSSPGVTDSYQINFPTAGFYPMEFGWDSANNLTNVGNIEFLTGISGLQFVPVAQPPRILATGFVSNETERTYLGLNQTLTNFGKQQLTYSVSVTSDEWLLNSKAVPYIPAFINQTAGQILAGIADTLMPGFINVTSFVGSGDLIPYYQYTSDQTFSDIAKFFGDALRYRYQVIDRTLYFEPFEQTPMGVAYDETTGERNFDPNNLTTQVVSVPPVNDCLVLGGIEPQANWENYFIGDGFTSQFRLLHQVFEGSTAELLEDDWTENEFQSNLWTVREFGQLIDGNGAIFKLVDDSGDTAGSLIVDSGSGVSTLGQTFVMGVNGVEMGGALNLQHGEFEFTDTCYGVVGGVYYNTALTQANCFAGFNLTTSGANLGQLLSVTQPSHVTASGAAGIIMQPMYLGQPVGPSVISQVNHTYLLQTWVGASQWNRYETVYRNLVGDIQYGGNLLAASGTITWVITDNDLGAYAALPYGTVPVQAEALVQPVVTKYTLQQQNPPEFVVYSPLNSKQLNLTLQNTILSNPPEGSLYVIALTGASGLQLPVLPANLGGEFHYLMGFGQQNQTATVLTQADTQYLAFYDDSIPGVGSRIRYQSWASQQASARVVDEIAIANEAAISGDDGVRSAIMTNLQPQPRTSAECELAAAAAIHDREFPQFQGTYTVEVVPNRYVNLLNLSLYDYPRSGEVLYINSPMRAVSGQQFVASTVRTQVTELRGEVIQVGIDYGPDLYLERLLPNFIQRSDLTQTLLTPQETNPPPDLINISEVGSAFLPDFQDAKIISIDNSLNGNSISIDLGVVPVTGCEIRRADFGWGNEDNNLIGRVGTQQFTLTRVSRDQTWYLRQTDGILFSRFSKALRVVYPFVPSSPTITANNATTINFALAGYVSDIYGLELRSPALSGIGISFPDDPEDSISYFNRVPLPSSTQVGNAYAVYNPPTAVGPTPIQVGDIVYLFSPYSDFLGPRLVTGAGLGGGVPPTVISPSLYAGTAANGYLNPQYAIDGNPATFADGQAAFGHAIAGEEWYAFPAGSYAEPLVLNVTSSAATNSNAEAILGFNNGSKGFTIYDLLSTGTNSNHRGLTTDQTTLPVGQDVTKIVVGATVNSYTIGGLTGTAAMQIYEIWIQSGITTPAYYYFSWYDYGYPQEDFGVNGQNNEVGETRLVLRGPTHATVSGSINSAGLATVQTSTNHGLVAGDNAILSCGYTTWPGGSYGPTPRDGAIFCGQHVVSNVPAANQISFPILNNPYPSGLPNVGLTGLMAKLPLSGAGVVLQRPVFAPSDLVVDLTEPAIAAELQLLQTLSPSGARVTELDAYFFNLKWDYSAATSLEALFAAPALSGGVIDFVTQQVEWQVAAGQPNGYRAVLTNNTSGNTQNKFTVNHPDNPQLLKQFQLSPLDFQSPLTIHVTPFDALGDGTPLILTWPGSGSGGGGQINEAITIITDPPMTGGDINTVFELAVPNFIGDTGTGGVNGLVPAPPAGSAASNWFLSASGTFAPLTFPSQPYDVVFSVPGQPPGNFTFPIEAFGRTVSFLANWAGSVGRVGTNPTSTATYTVKKNGSTVGTVVISTGGAFTFATTGGVAVTFNSGDWLTIVTPNPQDTTLADVSITLVGSR